MDEKMFIIIFLKEAYGEFFVRPDGVMTLQELLWECSMAQILRYWELQNMELVYASPEICISVYAEKFWTVVCLWSFRPRLNPIAL